MSDYPSNAKKRKAWIISGLLALCVLSFSAPALAQSSSDVVNRLNRIENEINTLSRAVYRGETPPPGAFGGGADQANTEVRIQQMETEIRDMRGMLEEQSYAVRQMQTQLERALADVELRLSEVESGGTPDKAGGRYTAGGYKAPPGGNAPDNTAEWNASPPVRTGHSLGTLSPSAAAGAVSGGVTDEAAALYENAFAMLKNNQFDRAEVEFQKFIAQYPNHVLTSNAKYWLGETYYVRGSYEQSARLFAEGYKQYPAGAKAADNLLKLGMSLAGMGNTQDACVAFEQLEKEFAGKSQPVLRRAEQEKTRAGCV